MLVLYFMNLEMEEFLPLRPVEVRLDAPRAAKFKARPRLSGVGHVPGGLVAFGPVEVVRDVDRAVDVVAG